MGSQFTFYDYVGDDGRNVVHDWLQSIEKGAKVKFNKRLLHLEATPPGEWKRPFVDTLDGHCSGLFEVRVARSGQQYRILGSHMGADRKPTLMHCFIKPGDKVPDEDCDQALSRKAQTEGDPGKHRLEHNYE
jgi:phage-related protein